MLRQTASTSARDARHAGRVLLHLRKRLGMTQQDVYVASVRHWGEGDCVTEIQLSRVENGKIAEPPMRLLCKIGYIYGLSANDMAELYRFPYRSGDRLRELTAEGIPAGRGSTPHTERE